VIEQSARTAETDRKATSEQWQAILEEYSASGKSVRRYCREKGMTPWQIYYHLRRARKSNKEHGFVELEREAAGSLWIEAGRCRIHVKRGFDAELLREVAEALS
jgi:transposase-like protein